MGRGGRKMLVRDGKLNGTCPTNRSDHDLEGTARVQTMKR